MTSASSGEGKTTAAHNLATVFAQNGEKVLIVDADLRKPRSHKTFDMLASPGLTEYLVRAPLVGCVLNNVDVSSSEYGEYSRYYYSYKQTAEESSKITSLVARGSKRRKQA